MIMCKLINKAIVPLEEVLEVTENLNDLLTELLANNNLSFSISFPINTLKNLVTFEQYNITNEEVKRILIKHGLLNDQGLMPTNTKYILESALVWGSDEPSYNFPVAEVLGDIALAQASL